MVTGVGLTESSSCAAIRCAMDNFIETRFMDKGGEWIIGSQVPLEQPWRGLARLAHMAGSAIGECLSNAGLSSGDGIPLLLCVAEQDRPGRLGGLDEDLFGRIEAEMGTRFHPQSALFCYGRVSGALAMLSARALIHKYGHSYCLIVGVDSLLVGETLSAYEGRNRLLTTQNSNGFIPGEAATAILISKPGLLIADGVLICLGIGTGYEKAGVDSEEPLRADGLVEAFDKAFLEADGTIADVNYRIIGANGEQYWFKEAALAVSRRLRARKEQFELWHPADCIGEVGAAAVPCALAIAYSAARKRYAPGDRVLCHVSGEGSERVALVLATEFAGRVNGLRSIREWNERCV